MRSATRRTSFALASVVSTRPCSSSEVTMFRTMAQRWALERPSLRDRARWRMALQVPREAVDVLPIREVVELHAEVQAHRGEHLLDLVQRLAAEVLRLQHLGLGALYELADQADVRVLEEVRRPHRELELVHRAEQVRIQRHRLVG